MRAAFLVCTLILCGVVHGSLPFASDRQNEKQVGAIAILNDDGSLQLRIDISFGNNDVDKVLALPGPDFERDLDDNTNEVPCEYTGTLGRNGAIAIESMVYVNGGGQGTNPCGARPIMDGTTLVGYMWDIQVREAYALRVYTNIDRTYRIRCLLSSTFRSVVTTSIQTFLAEDFTGTAEEIYPQSTLSVVSARPFITLNEAVRLRVDTIVNANRGPNEHYGSYVYHCDYRFAASDPGSLFIGDTGCPLTGNIFQLTQGFRFYQFLTSVYGIRYFQTRTPEFVAASSNPPGDGNYIYFSCYVRYDCYGTEGSDPKCTNFCASNLKKRKRRSTDRATIDADKLTVAVRIYGSEDPEPGTDNNTAADTEDSGDTTLIAVAAVVGSILFVLVIVGVCCVCYAFKGRSDDDDANDGRSSTEASTSNLPKHLTGAHIRPVKF